MNFRLWGLWFALLLLGACATQPAPIIVYGPPVDYGPPGDVRNPPQGLFQPNAFLRICPGMTVSNSPPADSERWILDYKPVILVGQVVLVTAPVNDVCLASGFGLRAGRPHMGIDLTSQPPGTRARPAAPACSTALALGNGGQGQAGCGGAGGGSTRSPVPGFGPLPAAGRRQGAAGSSISSAYFLYAW